MKIDVGSKQDALHYGLKASKLLVGYTSYFNKSVPLALLEGQRSPIHRTILYLNTHHRLQALKLPVGYASYLNNSVPLGPLEGA